MEVSPKLKIELLHGPAIYLKGSQAVYLGRLDSDVYFGTICGSQDKDSAPHGGLPADEWIKRCGTYRHRSLI